MILPVEHVNGTGTPMDEVYGVDGQALQELHRQREFMDSPQYNQPMKKLVDAFKTVERGRVTVGNTPGVYRVQGSKGNEYFVNTDGCNCPNGLHSTKTKYGCYHSVAVELYKRWQAAMQPLMALPLPPTTVDERLAQPISQETPMAAPRDAEYIPEPETATPEVVAPAPPVAGTTLVRLREPSLARRPETTLAAVALEASLEEWGKQRAVITRYIKRHFVEGTDYYTIKVGGRETKPTLGKPGAEKFMSLFQLQASFRKDQDTWDMLGCPPGVLCYICTLHTRSGEVVGEGRGARDIKKDGGDLNKSIKMGSKSAMIDAILRAGALSDAFTQDLDQDLDTHEATPTPVTTQEDDRKAIAYYLRKLYGMGGASKEAYETAVLKATGYPLMPEHYREIVRKLRALMDEAEAALDGSAR